MTCNPEAPQIDPRGTFDDVFARAVREVDGFEVAGSRTWGQWLRRERPRPWRPTADDRHRVYDAIRSSCRASLSGRDTLPSEHELRAVAQHQLMPRRGVLSFGVGPLTWLWIIKTVAQILLILKQWRER